MVLHVSQRQAKGVDADNEDPPPRLTLVVHREPLVSDMLLAVGDDMMLAMVERLSHTCGK